MGLFDQVLNAMNDPSRQANPDQLGGILSMVQQLSSNSGTDPGTMQSVLSVVGHYVRSSLQTAGPEQAQGLVNQYGGTAYNPQAVDALLGPALQQQVVQDVMQRTGLNPQTVQSLLPVLVPLALKFLQGGNNTQNPQGGNSVLDSFLDRNQDGNLDLGDALNAASQFFSR